MRCGEGVFCYVGSGGVISVFIQSGLGISDCLGSGKVISVWLLLMGDVWGGVSDSFGSGEIDLCSTL